MMTPVVNTVLLDFQKTNSREMIVENEDGSYTIFINSRISYNNQLEAYQHAMKHIQNKDFEKANVQHIESLAHQLPNYTDAKPISADLFEKRIQAIRHRRKKLRKQMEQLEAELSVLDSIDPDWRFRNAEYNHLYGFL